MFYSAHYSSPVGMIMLAAKGPNLVGLWNEGQKYHGASLRGNVTEKPDWPVLMKAKEWLDAYFAGERPPISALPLSPAGSAFRQGVWEILCGIPYGMCVTYGDIARKMAALMEKESMSSQAVGGAVGHNPISIVIPCHRVVGSNGSLTGYAGGLTTKIRLLELEGADTSRFFVPAKGTAL